MNSQESEKKGFLPAFARGFSEGTLGPRPEKRLKSKETQETQETVPSFEKRSKDEQVELMFRIHSLVDERKILKRSLRSPEEDRHLQGKFDVVAIGGEYITIPIPKDEIQHEVYDKIAVAQAKERLAQVESELKEMGSIPGLHEAYEKKLMLSFYIVKAIKKSEEYKARKAAIDRSIKLLAERAKAGPTGTLAGPKARQVKLLEQEKDDLDNKIADLELATTVQEGFDQQLAEGQYLSRIEKYGKSYADMGMVMVPSAQRTVQSLLKSMNRHQAPLLVGHLGSGKTAMARHAAKLFMLENGIDYDLSSNADVTEIYHQLEPEFFSGSEEASVYDLIGKLKIRINDTSGDPKKLAEKVTQYTEEISQKISALKTSKINIPKEDIAKVLLGKSDVIETIFSYGPLGRALKKGKPLIIDEMNRMPSEVLSRINDYLSAPVGTRVTLQENGGELFSIKPGFVVIGTANRGKEYDVKKMELSMKSRLSEIKVNYPTVDETYDIILAALIRKDRVRMPENFPLNQFDKLVALTVAAREIQENFSGQTVGMRFMSMIDKVESDQGLLERSVISTRDLMQNIIGAWKDDNFKSTLDEVVAEEFLKANGESKDEQKFMTEIFMRRGFFEDWSSEKFKEYDIEVSQDEIDTLRVQMDTEEYKKTDKHFGDILAKAQKRASLSRANLLIGVRREAS